MSKSHYIETAYLYYESFVSFFKQSSYEIFFIVVTLNLAVRVTTIRNISYDDCLKNDTNYSILVMQ